jgi:hypothetical protein
LSPWSLLTAVAVVAGIGAAAVVILDGDDLEDFGSAAEECASEQPDPFPALGAGIEYRPLSAAQQSALEASLPDEFPAERVEATQIVQGQTGSGAALAVPGLGSGADLEDFRAGFGDQAEAQGGTAATETIGGQEVTVGTVPQAVGIAGGSGCYAIAVFSGDPASARFLAGKILSP